MARYHMNSETGEPGLCRATERCPFGDLASEHYDSPLKAREAFEKAQGGSFLRRSKGFAKKMLAVGGMTVAAVSIAGCTSISAPITPTPDIPMDDTSVSDTLDEPAEPSWVEKAQRYVEENPINTPSEEEIENWLNEKQADLEKWLNEQDSVNGGSGTTYQTDGIYFQGESLSVSPSELATAQETLNRLVEQPSYDDGQYDRDAQFGRGFNTGIAGAVEHRDVPDAVFRNSSPQARVVEGTFIDPYTGQPVQVIGGESYDASIDHLVPLKEAYVSGANNWSAEEGKAFANDMDNLVYTDFSVNSSKGSKDASTWIPSYEPAQCKYAVQVIEIKGNYQLSVDSAEKAALQQIINTKCS